MLQLLGLAGPDSPTQALQTQRNTKPSVRWRSLLWTFPRACACEGHLCGLPTAGLPADEDDMAPCHSLNNMLPGGQPGRLPGQRRQSAGTLAAQGGACGVQTGCCSAVSLGKAHADLQVRLQGLQGLWPERQVERQ